jgi:hypothetical protein
MAGSGGAVKAGRAFVELFTESNPLYRGLDQAAARVKAWGAQIRALGAGLGAGGGALLGPLVASLKEVALRGTALQRLSGNTGHAVGELGAFADMAERAGVALDELNADVLAFDQRLRDAADAGGYVDDRLKGLGLASAFLGKSLTERLAAIAEYAKQTGDLRVVQIALTGTGQRLSHVFREGGDAMRRYGAGGALTADQAARAAALTDAWNSTLVELPQGEPRGRRAPRRRRRRGGRRRGRARDVRRAGVGRGERRDAVRDRGEAGVRRPALADRAGGRGGGRGALPHRHPDRGGAAGGGRVQGGPGRVRGPRAGDVRRAVRRHRRRGLTAGLAGRARRAEGRVGEL